VFSPAPSDVHELRATPQGRQGMYDLWRGELSPLLVCDALWWWPLGIWEVGDIDALRRVRRALR